MQFLQILFVLGHLAFLSNADSPFLRPHIVGSWLMHLFYVPRTADRCHKSDVSKEFSAFITTILPPFLGTTNSPWLGRDSIGWCVTNAPKSLQSILILIQPIELNYDHSIVLLLYWAFLNIFVSNDCRQSRFRSCRIRPNCCSLLQVSCIQLRSEHEKISLYLVCSSLYHHSGSNYQCN